MTITNIEAARRIRRLESDARRLRRNGSTIALRMQAGITAETTARIARDVERMTSSGTDWQTITPEWLKSHVMTARTK